MTDEEQRQFLFLFYGVNLANLACRLESQEGSKATLKRKHKKYPYSKYDLSLTQVSEYLFYLIKEAKDLDKCHDICKSLYFCTLERGHKGKHRDETGLLGW
jgi:hypothetical protein